jgi:phosphatidylserine/phosphatidylglycerophosphate/cardiolipin synthase-like enzyme
MDSTSLHKIIAIAKEMPFDAVKTLCADLLSLPPNAGLGECLSLIDRVSIGEANHSLKRLVEKSLNQDTGLTLGNLSFALQSAAAMDEHWRKSATYELVWTGPCPKGSVFRRMDQALFDVINEVQEELILVTFVTYKVPELNEGLEKAISRGVRVFLIIETDTVGKIGTGQSLLRSFGDFVWQRASFYHWPPENRPKDSKSRAGSLHVKCALGDKRSLLLSSANLTGHAFNLNMEMGVLIRNEVLAAKAHSHFKCLINDGTICVLNGNDHRLSDLVE